LLGGARDVPGVFTAAVDCLSGVDPLTAFHGGILLQRMVGFSFILGEYRLLRPMQWPFSDASCFVRHDLSLHEDDFL